MADDRSRAIELALSQIEKQFGKGSIMRLGNKEAIVPISVISTGAISFDAALGVGGGVSAAQAWEAFTDPQIGFGREAALDMVGLAQVIALRAHYARPAAALGQPAEYCDLRWYERARAVLREETQG